SIQDPAGDDHGPGKYVYPRSPVFSPERGLLDLLKLDVLADVNYYYFRLDFKEMSNPWGAPEGFSHQRIAIYIDSVPNQGRTETLREGSFVEFSTDHAWEYLIDIMGWNHSRVFYHTDLRDAQGARDGVEVVLLPKTKTIQAKVDRKLLDDHPDTWAYYVLIGSQDGLGPDGFRQVLAKPTQWQFGGGTDTYFDSNILDMLMPKGAGQTQAQLLGGYSLKKGKLAVLEPVAPPTLLKKPPHVKGWAEKQFDRLTSPFTSFVTAFPIGEYYPIYIAGALFVVILAVIIKFNWHRWKFRE
ncbi:MAG TPA: glucodextranase DOMON-like domain-containing protein, partial [Bacillota bacterium]|nr:glucodextranase DOMON-like domain-containing protein [Bacillota bacterium]